MILKKILIFYKNGSKRTSLKNKPKKYHVLLSTGKNSSLRVEFSITNSKCEKFLEIKKLYQKKKKKRVKSLVYSCELSGHLAFQEESFY